MDSSFRVLRRHAAIGILIAYSLYHSISLVRSSTLRYLERVKPDPIAALDKRFEPLKVGLSTYGCEKVGYITDIPQDGGWVDQYFRAQYTLAPIIVNDSTNASLVVGDFRNTSSIEGTIRDAGLSPVADYGNGVLLLSRRTH